jgi:glycine/D-amino acid oxidase-like deaminating enzyme
MGALVGGHARNYKPGTLFISPEGRIPRKLIKKANAKIGLESNSQGILQAYNKMMPSYHDAIIIGAGIAGVSAAYSLVRAGAQRVVLVDENAPLSLTSQRSAECYRNWWPGVEMAAFMNRSIDIVEELWYTSGGSFEMNRRGYLYLTANPAKIPAMQAAAEQTSQDTHQPLRIHDRDIPPDPYVPAQLAEWRDAPSGADLLLDPELIRRQFPCVSQGVVAALHARRAGWLSADGLGRAFLGAAMEGGATTRRGYAKEIVFQGGRARGVRLQGGETFHAGAVINAAGPYFKHVGALAGLELPVHTELHLKVAFRDYLGVIDRESPLLIWTDPLHLVFTPAERDFIQSDGGTETWLGEFPSGVHTRPEGKADSPVVLFMWEYRPKIMEPTWPVPLDDDFPEIALRGMAVMIPGLARYFNRLPKPAMDGGYYTKTQENRPLIGATPVPGYYLIGALSGYGIMASAAAGELLAQTVTQQHLPDYALAFALSRYTEAAYLEKLKNWGETGQL